MGGHPMTQSFMYARAIIAERHGADWDDVGATQPPIPASSCDRSIAKIFKFRWGLLYDRIQIAFDKIRVYDHIKLDEVCRSSSAVDQGTHSLGGLAENSSTSKKANQLYLGVMPRQSYSGEFQRLSDQGPLQVVSFLEDFENEEADLELGNVVRVPSPDFEPVPVNKIQEAVEAISKSLDNENVYVHCKSGKGRSAVAVLGYVMKQLHSVDKEAYQDPNVCFKKAVEIVNKSRSANTVRTAENRKAVVLLDWYRHHVLKS